MIVTAWNNDAYRSTGAGYGLKLGITDRDRYFRKEWQSIFLELGDQPKPVEINIAKPSFWNETCRELISAEIGRWMIKNGLVPWQKGHPPKLHLELIDERRFRLHRLMTM